MEPAVAHLGAFSDQCGLVVLSGAECPAGPIGSAVVPGRLDQQPSGVGCCRSWVIVPWRPRPPLDCSLGTSPARPPTVAPVKRCQSPTSTASPKPVSTPTRSDSPAGPSPPPRVASRPARRSPHPGGRGVPGRPAPPHGPRQWPPSPRLALTQQQLGQPMPGPHQITAASSRARTRSRAASSATVGTRTAGSSLRCNNRASRSASRRSVLTRSPGGHSSLDGATTTQPTRPPGAPGPGRTRSGQPHRPPDLAGQRPHPAQDRLGGRPEPQRHTSPVTLSSTPATID
jgi:hypothetical protein